jgi:hypothetical protein
MIDAPVVVAGGSPIGMTLALELASHGVAALLGAYPSARSTISRRASPVILSRCLMGADVSAVEICFAASSASAGDAHQEAQRFARAERGPSTHVSFSDAGVLPPLSRSAVRDRRPAFWRDRFHFVHRGERHKVRIGSHIKRSVAREIAQVERRFCGARLG